MQSESGKPRPRPMRETMPCVAAFVDQLRQAFGAEAIDAAIRAGMRGTPGAFYASEGGATIGTPASPKLTVVVHPQRPWSPR
jgi:hypothetical protein